MAATPPPAASLLERPRDGAFDLRVMNWNVWRNSIFPGGVRCEAFERIINAVRPDVICLQEVDPKSAGEIPRLMDRLLPLQEGLSWQVHFAANMDSVVVSRYPLLGRAHEVVMPSSRYDKGHVMCVVDLPESRKARDVYVIVIHFQSASGEANIRARQVQADAIVRTLRNLRQSSDRTKLTTGTPFLLLGDFNVYHSDPPDMAHHLTTLLTGNIVDETTFGPDIRLDWDGSELLEVKPRHNGRDKDWHTWRSDGSQFPPGALDRIVYSDSVLKVRSSFVLNTTTMSDSELAHSGLLRTDVLKEAKPGEFDHMPMVTDFVFPLKSIID